MARFNFDSPKDIALRAQIASRTTTFEELLRDRGEDLSEKQKKRISTAIASTTELPKSLLRDRLPSRQSKMLEALGKVDRRLEIVYKETLSVLARLQRPPPAQTNGTINGSSTKNTLPEEVTSRVGKPKHGSPEKHDSLQENGERTVTIQLDAIKEEEITKALREAIERNAKAYAQLMAIVHNKTTVKKSVIVSIFQSFDFIRVFQGKGSHIRFLNTINNKSAPMKYNHPSEDFNRKVLGNLLQQLGIPISQVAQST